MVENLPTLKKSGTAPKTKIGTKVTFIQCDKIFCDSTIPLEQTVGQPFP